MNRLVYILLCLAACASAFSNERAYTSVVADSVGVKMLSDTIVTSTADTLPHAQTDTLRSAASDTLPPVWQPNPLRAVWMGAIIPGYGQIYNRSYWKLPIVYGAFMGSAYAIIYTQGKYTDYKAAYRDIITDKELSTDPTRSYNQLLPEGYTIERLGGRSNYTRILQNRQSSFRRYRDISVVAAVVVYALSLIDAYVDAQLYDFDISEELSVNVSPEIYHDPILKQNNTEINIAINF